MTVGTVTVKLPKDLYTRLDTLAKQERTDVVVLCRRVPWRRPFRARRREPGDPGAGPVSATPGLRVRQRSPSAAGGTGSPPH